MILDPDISIDDVSKRFISTSFNIANELSITSMLEVRKYIFHMLVAENILFAKTQNEII